MSTISTDTIKKIALLARLDINDSDIVHYQQELTAILTLTERIQAVNTSNIEPIAHPQDLTQRVRHDVVTSIVDTAQKTTLQNIAPQTELGLYLVPQVMNDE